MDIPIADAPEVDAAEADTTVLTADMSGPLTMDDAPKSNSFEDIKPEEPDAPVQAEENMPREHQPQVPEGKVVTPAPVTGSSILSDDSVAPQQPAPQAAPMDQQVAPQPAPVPQQQMNQQPYQAPQPAPTYADQQGGNQYGQGYMPQGGPGVTVVNQIAPAVQEKLISPLGYIGYTILFNIPIVGLIFMFVWGFGSSSTQNLKNYARSYLIMMLIGVILWIIIAIISAIFGLAITDALSNY
jgi:hypothetical protein